MRRANIFLSKDVLIRAGWQDTAVPGDYDGIVAGDPGSNRIRQTFGFLSSWIATHDADGKPIIPHAKLGCA